jgi:hypothetical protein
VDVDHPADGVDEEDAADAAELCGVFAKIIDTVEVGGMEERIFEFVAGKPQARQLREGEKSELIPICNCTQEEKKNLRVYLANSN